MFSHVCCKLCPAVTWIRSSRARAISLDASGAVLHRCIWGQIHADLAAVRGVETALTTNALITNQTPQALVIPQRSVIEMQGIYQVFVLGDSSKVNLKIIQPGHAFKDAYVVEEGLTAKDKIAFGGTQLLKSGSKINPKTTDWKPGMDDKTTPTKTPTK